MNPQRARRSGVLRLIIAFVIMMMFATVVYGSPVTYQVNRVVGAGLVTGFIETDGTIGVLNAGNFVDWNLLLSDGSSTSRLTGPLSGGNSSIFVRGTDAAAFDSVLVFNFSGIDYGVLMFMTGSFSGRHYYCDSTQPYECVPGETVALGGKSGSYQNVRRNGIVVIGNAIDPAPEPPTAIMACTVAIGWILLKRRALIPPTARRSRSL